MRPRRTAPPLAAAHVPPPPAGAAAGSAAALLRGSCCCRGARAAAQPERKLGFVVVDHNSRALLQGTVVLYYFVRGVSGDSRIWGVPIYQVLAAASRHVVKAPLARHAQLNGITCGTSTQPPCLHLMLAHRIIGCAVLELLTGRRQLRAYSWRRRAHAALPLLPPLLLQQAGAHFSRALSRIKHERIANAVQ